MERGSHCRLPIQRLGGVDLAQAFTQPRLEILPARIPALDRRHQFQGAHGAGVVFKSCSPNLDLFDMTEADLIPECSGVVGAAYMLEKIMEDDDLRVLTY